ncbi:MAG TPA: calcium/sodium antiporter [Bacteroidales bacterium]|nr:calcium/sodium antiporter [Bacteroidales bacterium]
MEYLSFFSGLILLTVGAELLIRGASRLAFILGISPLLVGLTVVALGTSSPELVVSLVASSAGQTDLALGNLVGSNIMNVLLLLGLSALIIPLMVSHRLLRIDVPVMILASLLVLLLGLNGRIGLGDGIILLAGSIGYITYSFYISKKDIGGEQDEFSMEYGGNKTHERKRWWLFTLFVLVGLALLILGSRWMVESAVFIARRLGISELIIGLTIIAAGTSLPELATSVIASLKGQRDIAIGNVVGSNIMNLLVILGLSAVVAPDGLQVSSAMLRFDLPVMIVVLLACLPVFFTENKISRWEGGIFVAYYIAYVLYLILASIQHEHLDKFTWVMAGFVIPLTIITLVVVAAGYLCKVKSKNAKIKE